MRGGFVQAYLRISVELTQQHANVLPVFDEILAIRNDLIAFRSEGEGRGGRVQAQRLAQTCLDIRQIGHVVDRHGSLTDHRIDFFLHFPVGLRVLE